MGQGNILPPRTMKFDFFTLLGLCAICLTLCYCANVISKAWVAAEAVKVGAITLKVTRPYMSITNLDGKVRNFYKP